jgi:hypothetical protein
MKDVHATASFVFSLMAFLNGRPVELPSVQGLLLSLVDKGVFLGESKSSMILKPFGPRLTEDLLSFCLTAGPVLKQNVIVK